MSASLLLLQHVDDSAAFLARLQAGDRMAQHQLFIELAPHVTRLVVRTLGRSEGVADLVQEVFLSLLRDVRQLRRATELKRWATGVAINRCRNELRTERRRRWLSFLAPEELPEQVAPGVSGEDAGLTRATYAVLDRLDPEERLALVLRYLEGMPLGEAAEALGISLATFKRRLAAARDHFAALARDDAGLSAWLEDGHE